MHQIPVFQSTHWDVPRYGLCGIMLGIEGIPRFLYSVWFCFKLVCCCFCCHLLPFWSHSTVILSLRFQLRVQISLLHCLWRRCLHCLHFWLSWFSGAIHALVVKLAARVAAEVKYETNGRAMTKDLYVQDPKLRKRKDGSSLPTIFDGCIFGICFQPWRSVRIGFSQFHNVSWS